MHSIQPVVANVTGHRHRPQHVTRSNGIELDVEKLIPGLYILIVDTGVSFKFIKE